MKTRAGTSLRTVAGAVALAMLPIFTAATVAGQEQPTIMPPTVKPFTRSTGNTPQTLQIPGTVEITEPIRPRRGERPPTVFERCAAYPRDRNDPNRPIYCRTVR